MKDTFQWTDESVAELIRNRFVNLGPKYIEDHITAFKSSKAPKKEWEIVAFCEESSGTLWKLREDGLYRCDKYLDQPGYPLQSFLDDGDTIFSVRRLSDGDVFSLGDRLKDFSGCITSFEVKSVWSGGLGLRIDEGNADNILDAEKPPSPVLTTVDGAGIMEDQQFWVVGDDCQLSERIAGPASPKYIRDGDNIFSTREAAEAYVVDNFSGLSVKEARCILEKKAYWENEDYLKELTTLVEQKLKQ